MVTRPHRICMALNVSELVYSRCNICQNRKTGGMYFDTSVAATKNIKDLPSHSYELHD